MQADTVRRVDNKALPVISKIKRRNIHAAVGDTPFIVAAQRGHVGIMSVMYESRPDVLQQTDTKIGYTAMHYAAKRGHLAAVNQLLEWDSKLLDAHSSRMGMTPFLTAVTHGKVDVMEAMYAKGGKKLLTQTDARRWTALHRAAYGRHSAAVTQLLEWGGGAFLDIKGRFGRTPWDYANKRDRKIMEKYRRLGKKPGEGVFTFPDGSTWEGQWTGGDLQASGTYKWTDGRMYIGQYNDRGEMHGEGLMELPDGRRYEGKYRHDFKDGWGKLSWPDGRCYEGTWKAGKLYKGTYTTATGESRNNLHLVGKDVSKDDASAKLHIEDTDIFDAVDAGFDADEESVRLLISKDGNHILDKRDESKLKLTPFLRAALRGLVGIMSVMYESKPDVLQQTDTKVSTQPNHIVCCCR
ncbi:unnamed protein product [Vitrella brassicaformis CCMP3155]|uniref:Uncharacterized protein n=1 Tax=Vitrella brassicaformis (strain CCMP3155) TaxID=1169540 RepID=A0A0G4ELY3_VITBC|nr:unnamed protein product [Vitrella brassicaformis CCMP3155]|eukprot:CEL97843.1 unnamed protein product [Vitrella brassicaformis CCMP3155]